MHVVIDGVVPQGPISGTHRLSAALITTLAHDSRYRVTLLLNDRADALPISQDTRSRISVRSLAVRRRRVWLAVGLPRVLYKLRPDVFISFHNLAAPLFSPCPTIVTALDTIPFTHPQFYFPDSTGSSTAKLGRALVIGQMRAAVRRSSAVLSISAATTRSLQHCFSGRPLSISQISLCAGTEFTARPDPVLDNDARTRYDLPSNFVLAIGGADPRKNLSVLAAAHARLDESIRSRFPLVIVGGSWHGRTLRISDSSVRLLGSVDDIYLPSIYRLATVFAYPSLVEGFGLPILEAMACGTPVITSNTSSMPEVAGAAAHLVDPSEPEELRATLELLLSDGALRRAASQAGSAHSQTFEWEAAGHALGRVLESFQPQHRMSETRR